MSHLIFILRLFFLLPLQRRPHSPTLHPLHPFIGCLHSGSSSNSPTLPHFFSFLTCSLTFCLSHPPSPSPSTSAYLLVRRLHFLHPCLCFSLSSLHRLLSATSQGGSRDQGQIELGHWSALMAHRLRGQSGHLCRD